MQIAVAMRRMAVLVLLPCLASCSAVGYYAQAVGGHLSLMSAARPIDDWLADASTPEPLRQRLLLAKRMREFAARELGLPDNGSYTGYADLRRPFVVWNVFATPELSLALKSWCYPLFGCAGYRGYFDQADANALADELRAQGYDVNVAGVPAYSTLGWFDDPLLNTFINWPEGELARLIFHELAHQVVYARDDTAFNESFATAVEREGVRRWLTAHASPAQLAAYAQYERRRGDFLSLLQEHRGLLAEAFAAPSTDEEKRAAKGRVFERLQSAYRRLKDERWGGWSGYDRFFSQALNTAHLAAVGAYNDWVPAFEVLLSEHKGDLTSFYRATARLADLDKPQRQARLAALAGQRAESAALR
jgi:predicted aminopeptidase